MRTASGYSTPDPDHVLGASSIHNLTTLTSIMTSPKSEELQKQYAEAGINWIIPIDTYKEISSIISTFEGDEGLRRGTPLSVALRNCGQIWRNAAGSAETYELSVPVQRIRTFISHNWSVSRFSKFVAICLHFNLNIAALMTLVASVLLCLLHVTGVLPCYDDYRLGNGQPAPSGWAVRAVAPCVFLVVFFFGRSLISLFGVRGPPVFVDKVCIHQTNRYMQQKGILRLGAFLRHSDEMLVLYTNVYLLKLWTIFEVAAFLMLHKPSEMKVVPVNLAVLYIAALTLACTGPINVAICRANQVDDLFGLGFTIVGGCIYCLVLRCWHRDKQLMRERLNAFSVKSALCAVESDRALVCQIIVALLKAHERVSLEASDDEALEAFDEIVRTELPGVFAEAFGKYMSFTFRKVMIMSFVASVTQALDALGGLGEAATTRQTRQLAAGFCSYLVWGVSIAPIMWASQEYFASFLLHWRGWKDHLCVAMAQLATGIWAYPLLKLFDVAREWGDESNAGLAFSIAVAIVSVTCGNYFVAKLFA